MCKKIPAPGDLRPTDVVGAFFICGIAFLAAAAAAGVAQAVAPWPWGRWLALHLAFAGGVSLLVLGASQFFVAAFLATDPPPRPLVRLQLVLWSVGAALLAFAVPSGSDPLIWTATGLLVGALGVWAVAIAVMRRRSLRRSPWATRWYVAAACCFAVGMVAGSLLARGVPWPNGNLLGAHMSLNLAGWLGLSIVGTLHSYYPSLTQTQLRFRRLQGIAFVAWTGGVIALAAGYGGGLDPLATAGWIALCAGATALLVNVGACARRAPIPLSLPARVVGVAQPFLLAGALVAAASALADGPGAALGDSTRSVLGTLLVSGWIGLTVLGSLAHLLAVVVRVRGGFRAKMPPVRPRLDGLSAALATIGVAALALAQGLGVGGWARPAAVTLLLAAYAILACRVAALFARVLAGARPRI